MGEKHSTVDYVFRYSVTKLFAYHLLVLKEMEHRGYNPAQEWYCPEYRGKNSLPWPDLQVKTAETKKIDSEPIYSEHDEAYREECLANLKQKGISFN